MDLQVGGASKFSVDSGGEVFGSGVNSSLRLTDSAGAELEYSNWRIGIGGSTAYFYQTTIAKVGMGVDGLRLADSGALRWSSGSQASTGHDLLLTRDAAGTLGQRNGINPQTFNIYNTYTNATDYERAHIGWNDTADTFVIGTEAAGTGVVRKTRIGSGVNGGIEVRDYLDGTGLSFMQGGSQKFYARPAGLLSATSLYYDLGDATIGRWGVAYTQALDIDQGTLTDDAQALNITSTWNDAADTFTLIKADVTDTASAAGSKLLDLQVGGVSKFSVDKTGAVTATGFAANGTNTPRTFALGDSTNTRGLEFFTGASKLYYREGPNVAMSFSVSTGLTLSHSQPLGWASTTADGSPDTALRRDAANTLGQRNGVNAQTYNLYNTDDGAGNAEWLSLGFSANDATIQVAKSGTGVARPLFLRGQTLFLGGAAGANHWKISTAGHLLAQADNTYDIGAASANRPRTAYIGTTLDVDQGTLTDDAQALNLSSTWNDAADTFTLIKADVTDTASAAGSKLMDLQVGGTSKFSVAANGAVVINATGTNKPTTSNAFGFGSPATSLLGVWGGNRWCNAFGTDRMVLDSTTWLGFSSLAGSSDSFPAGNNVDVRLNRDAAGTLAQRNGVNAQTFNIYNTYTNATDYERGHIGWNDTADTFVIGTEAGSGGGVARAIMLAPSTDGVTIANVGGLDGTLRFGSSGGAYLYSVSAGFGLRFAASGATQGAWTPTGLGIGTTAPATSLDVVGSIAATGTIKATPTTVGALPAAATAGAGARTFVTDSANSLSSHHGQTVTGGGTDFSPVYSDGTTWRVG